MRTLPHVVGHRRTTLVALTERGRDAAREPTGSTGSRTRQAFYAGAVKPRELTHDSQAYRAYLQAAERLGARRRPHSPRRPRLRAEGRVPAVPPGAATGRAGTSADARWSTRRRTVWPNGPARTTSPSSTITCSSPTCASNTSIPDGRLDVEDVEVHDAPLPWRAGRREGPLRASAATASSSLGRIGGRSGRAGGRPVDPEARRGAAVMTLEEHLQRVADLRLHGAPDALPAARAAPQRRLSGAPVLRLRGHRPRAEDARLLRPPRRRAASRRPTPVPTGRARVYHLHHKALYRAIGEPETQAPPPDHARPRRRTPDGPRPPRGPPVRSPGWRPSERRSSTSLGRRPSARTNCRRSRSTGRTSTTTRFFADRLPIGVPDRRVGLRLRLPRHAGGAGRLSWLPAPARRPARAGSASWRVRLLVPRHLASHVPRLRTGVSGGVADSRCGPTWWTRCAGTSSNCGRARRTGDRGSRRPVATSAALDSGRSTAPGGVRGERALYGRVLAP